MSEYEKLMLRHANAQSSILMGFLLAHIIKDSPSYGELLSEMELLTELTNKALSGDVKNEQQP